MSDIIKVCKVHGELEFSATIKIQSSGEVTCRKCRHNQKKRKYQKEHPEYYNGYYQKNKEKIKERLKAYNQRPEVKAKAKIVSVKKGQRRKLKQYGMTQEDYDNLLLLQGSVCAICFKPETAYDPRLKLIKRLAIDHSHETGNTRGLLCVRCNLTLGRLHEDVTLLQSMIMYLNKYN